MLRTEAASEEIVVRQERGARAVIWTPAALREERKPSIGCPKASKARCGATSLLGRGSAALPMLLAAVEQASAGEPETGGPADPGIKP